MFKEKVKAIWCDHCNAEIKLAGVRSCVRQTCKTKELLPDARKVWK
jgi:hypothetical protein